MLPAVLTQKIDSECSIIAVRQVPFHGTEVRDNYGRQYEVPRPDREPQQTGECVAVLVLASRRVLAVSVPFRVWTVSEPAFIRERTPSERKGTSDGVGRRVRTRVDHRRTSGGWAVVFR